MKGRGRKLRKETGEEVQLLENEEKDLLVVALSAKDLSLSLSL